MTFEEFVESDIEVYFSITESTRNRNRYLPYHRTVVWTSKVYPMRNEKRSALILHRDQVLRYNQRPDRHRVSSGLHQPLVQTIPKLWDLYDSYGMSTLELNPIRIKKEGTRLIQLLRFESGFRPGQPAWKRAGLPEGIFQLDISPFESEINRLRTYQGQSDVLELNPNGTILPFMFGGGANSAATETLGDKAIFASDFGGNPPTERCTTLPV